MKKYTFDDIRNEGLLIYEYIRGSHAYGLQKPDGTSDVDTAGVYIEPIEQVLGLGLDFQEQIEDEKHDNVWFSLRKFMEMLLSSNPTVLESLFIPEDKILYEHPIMTEIKKHRNAFVTKACFKPFMGYAKTQIIKARGLNKKIVNPVKERLEPLDFAYTFYQQGSTKINNWLEYRGLKQQYCGLVHIPNMHDTYGVYYDWGNHFLNEGITAEDIWDYYIRQAGSETMQHMSNFIMSTYELNDMDDDDCKFHLLQSWFNKQKPIGYKGMVGEDGLSNELRLSSVSKGEKPICHLTYNKDGYTKHCKDYKEYKDWERNRNPERYKENKEKDFDRKNMSHSVRLMHMGLEIARTGQVNVDRSKIDRDFILGIRLGNSTYDELINYLDSKKDEMEKAMEESTLPDTIDVNFVNQLLLNIRETQIRFTIKGVLFKLKNIFRKHKSYDENGRVN